MGGKSGPSLIAFSETWLNASMDFNLIKIPGFMCIRQDGIWTEINVFTEGGVLLFFR